MHPDEVDTNVDLARRLVASQFPQWAELPIEPVASGGTSNAMYRLGDQLALRMPRQPHGVRQVEKEQRWLPVLALQLPLTVPAPVALGQPAEGYPLIWSVCPWLDGVNAEPDALTDPVEAARTLAQFVLALRHLDTTDAPVPGTHNFGRGVPLATRDQVTREKIAESEGLVDIEAVAAAWDADLNAPVWDGPPRWVHGDLQPGNLLAVDGRPSAVIDWGGLGIGDPAVDLLPAWNLFTGESRAAYREALEVDDASWARGRGWALSMAIIGLPYYINTNPDFVRLARGMLDEVLADHA
jgi:aminoglycoside phosphotransferase (APT) family kinase protein